jgi:putative ubiquitin-RnfH superfamily antitoxin RatB of RatAB toxin-antitoxin module
MKVELAYAGSEDQQLLSLELPEGSDVDAAIRQSEILSKFPEIDFQDYGVGIHGKICAMGHRLKNGDRVEIYRPLRIDPIQARRIRVDRK